MKASKYDGACALSLTSNTFRYDEEFALPEIFAVITFVDGFTVIPLSIYVYVVFPSSLLPNKI